jgi:nitronate monooxygenase
VRLSKFWDLMNDEFGEGYASSRCHGRARGPSPRRRAQARAVTSWDWAYPLVLAPMAGGPSTVALAAAAADGGLFPFLAGAYIAPARLAADIADLRTRSPHPFGVNVFAPSPNHPSMLEEARRYAALLAPWAASAGVGLGEPRYDDDAFAAKVDVLVDAAPAVVSFAFGWPPAEVVERLQAVGTLVWATVNDPAEVDWAVELGVDGLVAQGWEAGGHRGGPVDTGEPQPPVRDLVVALRERTALLVVAAGGVADG